jgi:hypothetical protein
MNRSTKGETGGLKVVAMVWFITRSCQTTAGATLAYRRIPGEAPALLVSKSTHLDSQGRYTTSQLRTLSSIIWSFVYRKCKTTSDKARTAVVYNFNALFIYATLGVGRWAWAHAGWRRRRSLSSFQKDSLFRRATFLHRVCFYVRLVRVT